MNRELCILLVEDDEDMLCNNEALLKMRGYRTLTAGTLAGAAAVLACERPDLILLDVNMPDGSGFDFITKIRKTSDIPVIFLTCRTDKADEIDGLTRGGGDYITKPFDIGVLLTRIDKQLCAAESREVIRRGQLSLHLLSQQAFLNGSDLLLKPKEFAVLRMLLENRGRTVTAEELYGKIWKAPMSGDGSAVWKQVSRLKAKLEDASGGTITVYSSRGEGYVLEI